MTMRLAIFLVVLSVVIQRSYGSLYALKKQGKYSKCYLLHYRRTTYVY